MTDAPYPSGPPGWRWRDHESSGVSIADYEMTNREYKEWYDQYCER